MTATIITALVGAIVAGIGWWRAHLAGDRERAALGQRDDAEAARIQAVAESARLSSLITTRGAEIARAWSAADACAAADPAAALRLLRAELDPTGARAVPPPDAPAGP